MTMTTIAVKDGNGAGINALAAVDGGGNLAPAHVRVSQIGVVQISATDLATNPFATATNGATTIIAGVSGKVFRIYDLFLTAVGAVAVTIQDTSGNIMLGPLYFPASGGVIDRRFSGFMLANPSAAGAGLVVNLSAGVSISGSFGYTLG